MFMRKPFASSSLRSRLLLLAGYRSPIGSPPLHLQPDISTSKHTYGYLMNKKLQLLDLDRGMHSEPDANDANKEKDKNVEQAAPPHPKRILYTWTRWIMGSILLLLPFSRQKREKFLRLEGEVEMVAEVVEKVANVAEKVSGDVADVLPDDGKLKEAALLVERISKETAKEAQLVTDFIHKVDELKEEIETTIMPVKDKGMGKNASQR